MSKLELKGDPEVSTESSEDLITLDDPTREELKSLLEEESRRRDANAPIHTEPIGMTILDTLASKKQAWSRDCIPNAVKALIAICMIRNAEGDTQGETKADQIKEKIKSLDTGSENEPKKKVCLQDVGHEKFFALMNEYKVSPYREGPNHPRAKISALAVSISFPDGAAKEVYIDVPESAKI